ncbi:MAG: hypothetical protein PF448_10100 [Bacteroidales bacterium]|jgi:hypothetical protein|nr:hypothetical protein [Bacteroidales bacterium]
MKNISIIFILAFALITIGCFDRENTHEKLREYIEENYYKDNLGTYPVDTRKILGFDWDELYVFTSEALYQTDIVGEIMGVSYDRKPVKYFGLFQVDWYARSIYLKEKTIIHEVEWYRTKNNVFLNYSKKNEILYKGYFAYRYYSEQNFIVKRKNYSDGEIMFILEPVISNQSDTAH